MGLWPIKRTDLASWVEIFDGVAEFGAVDMGVDLGGGDVGVSEEVLDDAEIRTPRQEMGGEGVAEHVGVDVLEAGLG